MHSRPYYLTVSNFLACVECQHKMIMLLQFVVYPHLSDVRS